MRAPLALGLALVALLAIATSAAAERPTPISSYAGTLQPIALRMAPSGSAVSRAAEATPSPSPAAGPPAAFIDSGSAPVPTLAPRRQPAAQLGVIVKPTPTPRPRPASAPRSVSTGSSLRGRASWYCNNDGSRAQISACHYRYPDTGGYDAYAAAGPKLRAALGGGWRGRIVYVDGLRVKLVDWCQCYQGQPHEKIIDLYLDVFRRVGGEVTIRW